jgi:biopolymer transport protein TolR
MARIKKRKTRRFKMPEVSLTPLIDTALTLLVIFMVTAPMMQHGLKVDLPHGKAKEVSGQQELVVTMSKDGKLYFNSFPVEKKDLAKTIKKEMGYNADLPVYVRADKELEYGKVVEVVDELKGVAKLVALSTRSIGTK